MAQKIMRKDIPQERNTTVGSAKGVLATLRKRLLSRKPNA